MCGNGRTTNGLKNETICTTTNILIGEQSSDEELFTGEMELPWGDGALNLPMGEIPHPTIACGGTTIPYTKGSSPHL